MSKLIRDTIHGYIEIDDIIVEKIIDTPVFQRLRQIEQTSMRALYPSAHHDRFVHSLGVYHLGKLAYSGLINNIKSMPIYTNHKEFWASYGICFQIACLLHDCGHAPMSHSFEYAYLDYKNSDDCFQKKERFTRSMLFEFLANRDIHSDICKQTENDIEQYFSEPRKIAPHELISAQLVTEYFIKKGHLKEVLSKLIDSELTNSKLNEYTIFIQRAIIGLSYSINLSSNKLEDCFKNCLITLLNGNFFDVDKLDYIIRDTNQSGTNNIMIDIPRILNALTLVEINRFNQDTNVKNLELNNSVYFTGCSSELINRSETCDCECALDLSDVHLKGILQGRLKSNGSIKLKTSYEEGSFSGHRIYQEPTEIEAWINDSGSISGSYSGLVEIMGHKSGTYGRIDGSVNAKITGSLRGTIIGHIDGVDNNDVTYEIGYLKTALNVIEDTLIARNRLYLWIYGHHKVTYTDFSLRHGILRSFLNESHKDLEELEKINAANKLLAEAMNVDNVFFEENMSTRYLLSDGDLIHQMKVSLFNPDIPNPYAKEWCDRKHMYPIWKSYIEYNNFFSNLDLDQRKALWCLLFNGDSSNSQNLPPEANSAAYDNSILRKYGKDLNFTWIKPAGIKLKEMDVSNIYIVLSDNSVKRLKDVMSQAKVSEQYADESFFYLYSSIKMTPAEKLQLISSLKKEVKRER